MNNFSIKATVVQIFEVQTIKDFKKQSIIVSNNETKGDKDFSHKYHLEFLGDKIDLLKDVTAGQELTFHFNIKTNDWEKDGKTTYFTSLAVWKIEK